MRFRYRILWMLFISVEALCTNCNNILMISSFLFFDRCFSYVINSLSVMFSLFFFHPCYLLVKHQSHLHHRTNLFRASRLRQNHLQPLKQRGATGQFDWITIISRMLSNFPEHRLLSSISTFLHSPNLITYLLPDLLPFVTQTNSHFYSRPITT